MSEDYSKSHEVIVESIEQLTENGLVSEMVPFQEEIYHYKDNLLLILMNLVSTEINRLPETQREVMLRHYIMGESLRVIAKNIGIKWYAVHRRKLRALQTLKNRLNKNPYANDLYKKFEESDPPVELLVKISEFLGK